jgi:hypothetical protein
MNNASIKITEAISRESLIGALFIDHFTDVDKAGEGCEKVFSEGLLIGHPLTVMNSQRTNVLFNGSVYNDDRGKVLGAVLVAREVYV